ncbi:hypothetical protein F5Y04DRAFT_277945 [Hypomontagnella monticulosa]|nr:hypothetical protein F5Y04DRAFT_277945 [Hypomontagnella monticulosa]
MRALTLTVDILSAAILVPRLIGTHALAHGEEPPIHRDNTLGEALKNINYGLFGGPQPDRGAYSYPTPTYGGYGPPPPPPSSKTLSSTLSTLTMSNTSTSSFDTLSTSLTSSTMSGISSVSSESGSESELFTSSRVTSATTDISSISLTIAAYRASGFPPRLVIQE